jgi:hypothetical protein
MNFKYLFLLVLAISIVGVLTIPNSLADKESPVLGILFLVPNIDMLHSMAAPTDLKNISADSISFLITIPYHSSGELHDDCVDWTKDKARSIIKKYKQAGFTVVAVPGAVKVNPLDYSGGMYNRPDVMQAPPGFPPGGPPEGFPGGPPGGMPGGMPDIAREMTCSLLTAGGEPGSIPGSILNKVLENYEPVVIELAKIAEEEGADVFAPMAEPDLKMGSATKASKWSQDMLPKIKEVYSGKLLWRGDFHNAYESSSKQVDFTGFDIIGFTTLPGGPDAANIPNVIAGNVDTLTKWAEEDGVEEVWISEFGISVDSPQSEADKAKSYQEMFEASAGKLDGYLLTDIPYAGPGKQVGWPGTPLKGSTMEPIVEEWFKKMADSTQTTQVTEEVADIPFWIKNSAGWWAEGQLSDSDFVSGIQWLIANGIIEIPYTEQSTETASGEIPDWIKNNAGWWANGNIPDSAFISGLQWLISNGIMKVS